MSSVRSLSSLTICVCIIMSVCPLRSTATSLWGNMLKFESECLCQLRPEAALPALRELSVCVLVRRTLSTKWTAFVYKAPTKSPIELGLEGKGQLLTVWLFGKQWQVQKELRLHEWHSVCLTWSARAQRMTIYVNRTSLEEMPLSNTSQPQLSQNGTLTLGASHYVQVNGKVKIESGSNLVGEIGLFRMWSKEWSAEELWRLRCADGDVVSWDLRNWKHECSLVPEKSLHCAWPLYKIEMWTLAVHSTPPVNCSMSPEKITRDWLESIFQPNISVLEIVVSPTSHTCPVVNHSAALHAQQTQALGALPNSTCQKCYHSEVHINVEPAANVELVQANVTALLNATFSNNFLNLTADARSIRILPSALFPGVTTLPPAVSPEVTTSERGVTQSLPVKPTSMSTTREPLDLNLTFVGPDIFFRVNLTLSITGNPPEPEGLIKNWVKERLEGNKTMVVLNFIIKNNVGRNMKLNVGLMDSADQQKQYYCTFHVQEFNMNSVAESETFINVSLTSEYKNSSILIKTDDLAIKHIVPEDCKEDTTTSIKYGEYIWPETFPQVIQEMQCTKPVSEKAYRLCQLDPETDETSWADPDMTNCDQLVSITDLTNITVTSDNMAEVAAIIQELVQVQLNNSDELSSHQLTSVVDKLKEVVDINDVKPSIGVSIIDTISNMLLSKTDLTPVSNNILNLTDKIGDTMDFHVGSLSLTAPSVALSMIDVDPDQFGGLTFVVSSVSPESNPKVFLNQSFVSESPPEASATISLPSSIQDFFPPHLRNKTRIQFQFYATDDLFQDQFIASEFLMLNSQIISASIKRGLVVNLQDRVIVTLSHRKPAKPDKVQCMFWDFNKNAGQGGWNNSGCQTQNISPHQTSCLCDHLTQFAVLLDISRAPISETDSYILTMLSYVGCGISCIFLGITLLTYLLFEKLRRDYPSKILINLSVAMLGLNLIFLLNSWLASLSNYGLCISTAAVLHYFLLATFSWMGLEAFHMYMALVKVFNTYVPSYIPKFCAMGWGIPLVIVCLVLAIDKDVYGDIGSDNSSEPYCWLQNEGFFYVTVVAFVLLILLGNMCVFIGVLIQIRKMNANKPSANRHNTVHHLRAVVGLTVLLGLTWLLGFFSFGPGRVVMMYLFTIANTLQGFFVFIFHCLMKENVRKQWSIHFCCGRFSEYSDRSRSATAGSKKKNLVNSESVASENTSTSTAPNLHQ
ncbi:adhesion G-protein coupled receptor G4 [Mugil cephalus]|uniref:adhesion G-protein coupled receptor G4 n=1 Tax=Mugil cephalus TaxID=48193 RepID=UPI001FB8553A|nr:adhesion G-protein coupled receptor G4 [Mugil cephalus]